MIPFGFQSWIHGGWAEYMTFPARAIVHRVAFAGRQQRTVRNLLGGALGKS